MFDDFSNIGQWSQGIEVGTGTDGFFPSDYAEVIKPSPSTAVMGGGMGAEHRPSGTTTSMMGVILNLRPFFCDLFIDIHSIILT